ncbi:MAG: hypothetical protein RJA31_795 [Actinomycetota bacterium]|jgi:biotin transporter BioY
MDSFLVGAIVIGLVALPFIGAKWSYIVSIVIAGLLASYGIVGLVTTAVSLPFTNSDLAFAISGVFFAAGCLVALVAWVIRRRVIKRSASNWS